MKRILVTGKGSYIGTHFIEELSKYPDKYQTNELEMRDESWKQHNFSQYDIVYHVAGLAHSTPDESQRDLYYKVNTDLTYEVAKRAKESGVKQFIFMSSIIVYGSGTIGENRIITKDTPLTPDNFYGDSKLQAEIKLSPLQEDSFNIVIIRPPMIYGPNSKGNYPVLSKLAHKLPCFPNIKKILSARTSPGGTHPSHEGGGVPYPPGRAPYLMGPLVALRWPSSAIWSLWMRKKS